MMDYEERRRQRRWLILFLLHACLVGYLVVSSNPLLYSHKELRRELLGSQSESVKPLLIPGVHAPAPVSDSESAPTLTSASIWRGGLDRAGMVDPTKTHDREFVVSTKTILPADVQPRRWVADGSGAYLGSVTPMVLALSSTGELRWQYKLLPEAGPILTPALAENTLVAASQNGTVVSLLKDSGRLRWWLKLASEINSDPLPLGERIAMIVKPLHDEEERLSERDRISQNKVRVPSGAEHRLVLIDTGSGRLVDYSQRLLIKGEAFLTATPADNLLLVANDNRLSALELATGNVMWTQTLPDPIVSAAIFVDGKVYVSLQNGKIQIWDPLRRGGKFESEHDVGRPIATAPIWIPTYNRLAVLTKESVLHVVDLKKPELSWRFNLELSNSSQEAFAARLASKHIEPLNMKWERKGWTLWTPCAQARICIYNPDKGQIVSRIGIQGTLVDRPLLMPKDLLVLVKDGQAGESQFAVVHLVDSETAKRKAKSEAKSQAKSDPGNPPTATPPAGGG